MLAIVASERCYVSDLLEKLSYTKEESPNKSEVYKCTYKTHEFIILVSGYGKVNIASNLRYICEKYNRWKYVALVTGAVSLVIDILIIIICW